jgi:monoamine oxidase
VERIAWGADGVRVTAAGAEASAAAAVIAVPASVIDRIAFDPPLPGPTASALAAVRYGHAAKLFLPLAEDAPPSATLSVPDRFWTFTQLAPDGGPLPVAGSFAGSPRALERLRVAEGPDRWIAAVRDLRPDLAVREEDAVLSTWADDPWVRGAYSTSPPAALAALPERSVGPLAFAGEHLGGAFAALMEGAIRSGRQAARSLLAVRTRP